MAAVADGVQRVQRYARVPHYRKLKSGRWNVIAQVDGQRETGTADTRAGAQRLGAQLINSMGGTVKAPTITVAELLATHIAEADYAPTTLTDIERVIAKTPASFLARPIAAVTPYIIDQLYSQLARDGWTPHRIKRLNNTLGAAFRRAKRWGWIERIPTRDATTPRISARTDTTPDGDDALRLVQLAATETDIAFAVYLGAVTGMRREEVCGLQWADLDERAGEIRIERAVTYTPTTGVQVGPTKTDRSRRTISVDAGLFEVAATHRRNNPSERWVFTHDGYTPWRPDFLSRRFRQLATRAGTPGVRFQDLRHFVVTKMIELGIDPRTVADYVGHSQVSFTLTRYAASWRAQQRTAAAKIGEWATGSAVVAPGIAHDAIDVGH